MFRYRAFREWMVLAVFCGFLFFFGLSFFGLVGADEPRYAQIAREMLARHDWVTPVLGGVPWLEKPVLYYWQAMAAYSLFGVSDAAARLPSAFDATLMVFAAFLFLRKFRPGYQLDGALIVASGAGVFGFARAASTDMPLASMFAIAMMAWYAWYETANRIWLAVFYVFLGLGVLAKGPVAVFLAGVVLLVFTGLRKDLSSLRRTLWLPGILLFCLAAGPWYVLVQLRNPQFLRIFILQHNLERFGSNLYHHRQPFWFYIPVALLALLPWTTLAVNAVVERTRTLWRGCRNPEALGTFLLIWLVVPIAFFSISQSKLPGYILPALPAGALLIVDWLASRQIEKFSPLVVICHALLSAGLIVFAILFSPAILIHHFPRLHSTVIVFALSGGFAALCALFMAKYGIRAMRFATLAPLVIAVSFVLKAGAPAIDNTFSARPVAARVAEEKGLPASVFGVRREVEYGLQFYLNRTIPRYELGQEPAGEHVLIAREGLREEIAAHDAGRKVIYLGNFPAQHLEFYWVSAK